MIVTQTKKSLALVFAVDQLLDYYELMKRPPPEVISIEKETHDALCSYTGEDKLTHYRKVRLKLVSKNTVK